MAASQHEVTELLRKWRSGDKQALDKLTPLVYDELHRLAHQYINRERRGHIDHDAARDISSIRSPLQAVALRYLLNQSSVRCQESSAAALS